MTRNDGEQSAKAKSGGEQSAKAKSGGEQSRVKNAESKERYGFGVMRTGIDLNKDRLS